jgi:hypothetical protein
MTAPLFHLWLLVLVVGLALEFLTPWILNLLP